MTQLLDAIETERRQAEEDLAAAQVRFDNRVALLDDMAEKARRLNGAEKPAPSKPKRQPKPADKPRASGRPDRKTAILEALRNAHPEKLRSKDLQKVVGLTSASGIRPLLDELLAEGKIVKTGQRAGTRYGIEPPAAPALGDEAGNDDEAVIEFLRSQKQPHSIPLIAMKTKVPSARVVAALNRLKNARRVHVVRIGAGNAFEAVGK